MRTAGKWYIRKYEKTVVYSASEGAGCYLSIQNSENNKD